MLYFAYGSNMSLRQMQERCPGHERLGIALLPDHTLCFPRSSPVRLCGVAGVVPQRGSEVWGVVYRLNPEDLAALDKREGYDPTRPPELNRYNRHTIRVLMNGEPLSCETYLPRPEPGTHLPSHTYLATILEGAEENGLPEAYLAALRRL